MKKEQNLKFRVLNRIAVFFALALACSFLLPSVQFASYANFKPGHIAPETIIAPYDYEILKSQTDIDREKELVKSKVVPLFDYQDSTNNILYLKFASLPQSLAKYYSIDSEFQKYQLNKYGQLNEVDSMPGDSLFNNYRLTLKRFEAQFTGQFNISVKDIDFNQLSNLTNFTKVKNYLHKTRGHKFLNINKNMIPNNKLGKISFLSSKKSSRNLSDTFDPSEKKDKEITFLQSSIKTDLSSDTAIFWQNIINHFSKPNTIYLQEQTENEITARQNDLPIAKGLVKKGEEIIEKGKIITDDTKDKLNSLEIKERELVAESSGELRSLFKYYSVRGVAGNALLTIFPFMLLFTILYYNRKSVFYSSKKLTLLLLLILLDLTVVFFGQKYLPFYNEYLIFLPTTAMLLAIFFDTRVAFFSTIITALISTLIMRNNFSFFYVSAVIGVISIYTVSRIRDRFSLFLRPFLFLLLSLSIIAVASNLHSSGNQEELLTNLLYAAISSFLAPVLTFTLVALIEHYFKLPTDISLLELSDMTHPLLKKLQTEAPATYHHSIVIGNLSEAAAEAICANSLLARVGSYYHDIGKTFKPEYFIENQQNKVNRHDKLPPNMSAIILAAHVKEGLKLAKEHNLPQILSDFIAMHHGTSRMEFFYHKALELSKETGEKVDEKFYRYPGPKPNTKETAIMMIADIVEARCRTIDKPDYETYRTAINEIIHKKFQEGELDECDLKLNDLAKIREAMLPVIIGMYHSRIKYPDQIKPAVKDSDNAEQDNNTDIEQ